MSEPVNYYTLVGYIPCNDEFAAEMNAAHDAWIEAGRAFVRAWIAREEEAVPPE